MTYEKAIKIIGKKSYSDCSISEKKEMDIAIDFINNPTNMPKGTFERDICDFRCALINIFYIKKINKWLNKFCEWLCKI